MFALLPEERHVMWLQRPERPSGVMVLLGCNGCKYDAGKSDEAFLSHDWLLMTKRDPLLLPDSNLDDETIVNSPRRLQLQPCNVGCASTSQPLHLTRLIL